MARKTKEEKAFEVAVKQSTNKVLVNLQIPIFELTNIDNYIRKLVKEDAGVLSDFRVKEIRDYAISQGARETK